MPLCLLLSDYWLCVKWEWFGCPGIHQEHTRASQAHGALLTGPLFGSFSTHGFLLCSLWLHRAAVGNRPCRSSVSLEIWVSNHQVITFFWNAVNISTKSPPLSLSLSCIPNHWVESWYRLTGLKARILLLSLTFCPRCKQYNLFHLLLLSVLLWGYRMYSQSAFDLKLSSEQKQNELTVNLTHLRF